MKASAKIRPFLQSLRQDNENEVELTVQFDPNGASISLDGEAIIVLDYHKKESVTVYKVIREDNLRQAFTVPMQDRMKK